MINLAESVRGDTIGSRCPEETENWDDELVNGQLGLNDGFHQTGRQSGGSSSVSVFVF